MKKLLAFLCLVPLLLASCSESFGDGQSLTGNGEIILSMSVGSDTNAKILTKGTPTTDFSTYWVALNDDFQNEFRFPADGMIKDLAPGNYTVTVKSHQGEGPDPAFDVQYYIGSTETSVVVAGGGAPQTAVIRPTQGNAGVKFSYGAGVDFDVIPTIADDSGTLVYNANDGDQVGYFMPGQVRITAVAAGKNILFNGEEYYEVAVEAKDMWTVKLVAEAEPAAGAAGINVKVAASREL